MSKFGQAVILITVFTLFWVMLSYGLARLGHPTSVWLWRDILHIMG